MSESAVSGLRLGIDIGGTKTQGILLDRTGNQLADVVRATTVGPDGVVATAIEVATAACTEAGRTPAELASIGVGIPGLVDPDAGIVRTAVNLGIAELDLAGRLQRALGGVVRVENDVKATVLGAASFLGLVAGDLCLLNIGTGVAASALIGGRLLRGQGNLAGEIGHLSLDPGGDVCGCGQRGCLETQIGGAALSRRLAGLGIPLRDVIAIADSGDEGAQAEVDRVCAGIATAVQVLVLAYGSARVVLSGGVMHTAPELAARTGRLLATRAAMSPFLSSLSLPERIVVLPADYPVAAIGAALLGAA